jgi:hypothetical protein
MEQASGASSDESKAELLRVATEWLQLAEEIGRLEDEMRAEPLVLRIVK